MATGAALVSGCVLPARPARANHLNSRIQASRSRQFNRNRGRPRLRCSDTGHLFGCAHARGHLTVAHAEGSTIFVFSVGDGGWSLNTHVCLCCKVPVAFALMIATTALAFLLLMFN